MERNQLLELERAKGDEYKAVYETYIKPFVDEKQKVLFEAFQNTSIANVDQLKDIKAQSTALNALAEHFKRFIETGEIAKYQLENDL